jgi:hypothetical protein
MFHRNFTTYTLLLYTQILFTTAGGTVITFLILDIQTLKTITKRNITTSTGFQNILGAIAINSNTLQVYCTTIIKNRNLSLTPVNNRANTLEKLHTQNQRHCTIQDKKGRIILESTEIDA